MSPGVTPLGNIERRLPLHGKIRLGEKGSRGEPRKLSTMRFTSADRDAIHRIAGIYGGEPTRWTGAPTDEQWQVTTQTKSIPVALPPDPLFGPFYEMWSAGGLQRRCDGVDCTIPMQTPDGAEMVVQPCLCARKEALACTPKVRLSVILRDIRFAGVWMLESSGWNSVHELPGMVELVQMAQSSGMVVARLGLGQRKKTVGGKTRKFVVPELSLDSSIDELMAGEAGLARLVAVTDNPAARALPEGSDPEPVDPFNDVDDDDEIVDAEIVDEDPDTLPPSPDPAGGPGGPPDTAPPPPAPELLIDDETQLLMQSVANDHRIDADVFVDAMARWSGGNVTRLLEGLDGLRTGGAIWRGIDDDGAARINKIRKPS